MCTNRAWREETRDLLKSTYPQIPGDDARPHINGSLVELGPLFRVLQEKAVWGGEAGGRGNWAVRFAIKVFELISIHQRHLHPHCLLWPTRLWERHTRVNSNNCVLMWESILFVQKGALQRGERKISDTHTHRKRERETRITDTIKLQPHWLRKEEKRRRSRGSCSRQHASHEIHP